MKLKLLAALLATVSINAIAQDVKSSTYETSMEDLEKFCPSCQKSLAVIMDSLSQNCGLPKTSENIKFVGTTHPMYSLSLAAISKLDTDIEKDAFYKAVTDSATADSCWDASHWVKSSKTHLDSELLKKLESIESSDL
ncbi:hypothetical protein IAH99_13925 [Vibrio cholerae]|uniref:hypothetical protein n=1 Tax=Vibrio cholerae TaxID=666 RepID=UPI0016581BF3|nr:hypothetical protein [Vibrio cholerae]MBC9069443.1 hypothetical protein [Vibrio cholerae]